MKKVFEKAVIEKIAFDIDNVIVTSDKSSDFNLIGSDGEGWDDITD